MKRAWVGVVSAMVFGACADVTVAVVIERGTVCDPGDPPTSCRLVSLPEDGGRELLVYRADPTTVCDDAFVRQAAALDPARGEPVHAQSFRGSTGAPIGALDEGRYTFVALVRRAAESCSVGWSGCAVVAIDGERREVEIELSEVTDPAGPTGCGETRVCVASEGRCE